MEDWRIYFNVAERGANGNVTLFGDSTKMDLLPIDFCKSGSFIIDDENLTVYTYSQSKKVWIEV